MPFLTDQWYNPSSGYRAAKLVRKALELAHEQVAELIHAKPTEIVFTGCGTESNNAVLSFLASRSQGDQKIITSAIEHSAILRHAEYLSDRHHLRVEKVGAKGPGPGRLGS